jgi:hypothetical protein
MFPWSLIALPALTVLAPSSRIGIPLLDLAYETERQVVIASDPEQYLGHPTTVLLADNRTMLCVYPKGHGKGAIVLRRSEDAGITWSEPLPVPENWATSLETPTLYRAKDPAGVERLILFSGLYPIRLSVSEDEGRTWTPLAPIGEYGGIVAMSSVVPLTDGRLLALFHDDGRFLHETPGPVERITLYSAMSSDGGLTWDGPRRIYQDPEVDLCEPGAVRSPDGSEIAMLLRENRRLRNAMVMFSRDEGETWSAPSELPGALTGDRHQARHAADGRLVVCFRDMAFDSPTRGDFVAWVGRYEDLHNGGEGLYRVRLLDNRHEWDCGYPGLELLPDGTFVATTYCHMTDGAPPSVVSVRFTLEELDARIRAAVE